MTGYWLALFIYLWAGYTQAELAFPGMKGPFFARAIAYTSFVFLWIVFMPWYPKMIEKRRNNGRFK